MLFRSAAAPLEDPDVEDELESGETPEPLELFPPDPEEPVDDDGGGPNW